MTKRPRYPIHVRIGDVMEALDYLRYARERLVQAGTRNSANAVRRALKSAEGALRHLQGLQSRQRTDEGQR
jgi:hypothetical protein